MNSGRPGQPPHATPREFGSQASGSAENFCHTFQNTRCALIALCTSPASTMTPGKKADSESTYEGEARAVFRRLMGRYCCQLNGSLAN